MSAQESSKTIRSHSPTGVQSSCARYRRTFRPLTLGLIGLSFAVALWGSGYKLSLYGNTEDSAPHIPVAKLWIEHRFGTAIFQLPVGPRVAPALPGLPHPFVAVHQISRVAIVLIAAPARPLLLSCSAIPFRSPPHAAAL